MYEEHVLKHFSTPCHKGLMPNLELGTVYSGKEYSYVCGDTIDIFARIKDGVITEIWWQSEGCCFSQAAASMLAEYATGKTVDDMQNYRDDEMLTLFQAECPAARRDCVLVSLRALRNLLESYPC